MTSTPTISYKLGNKVPAGKGLGVQADPLDSLLQDRSETLPDVVPVQDGFEYSIWVSCGSPSFPLVLTGRADSCSCRRRGVQREDL